MRTALAAAADMSVRAALPALLASADITLVKMVSEGLSVPEAAACCRSDLLVMDVCLPGVDGSVLAERVLASSALPVRPELILLFREEFPPPNRAKLEEMGAVCLPWPTDPDAFRRAVEELETRPRAFYGHVSSRADALLDALGLPDHPGRDALRCAVLLCARDERLLHGRSKRLYPMVGEMLRMPPTAVERSMRWAIGAAWQSDKFENQYRIFADTVDAGRGQPSCGEMIARLADILRLEG